MFLQYYFTHCERVKQTGVTINIWSLWETPCHLQAKFGSLECGLTGAQYYSSERPNNWLECSITGAQFYSSERPNFWLWYHRGSVLQQWETKLLTVVSQGLSSTAVRDHTTDLNVVSHGAQFYSSERPNNWLECGLTGAQFYNRERPNLGSVVQQWETKQLTWVWSHRGSILQQWETKHLNVVSHGAQFYSSERPNN